jgi:hypothetical protein
MVRETDTSAAQLIGARRIHDFQVYPLRFEMRISACQRAPRHGSRYRLWCSASKSRAHNSQDRPARRTPRALSLVVALAQACLPDLDKKSQSDSLAAAYRTKYHIPAHAKLLCPLGNDLNPSWSRSVRVQTRQSTRPCTGLDVRSAGSWHRSKRSGRGRPAVIWCQRRWGRGQSKQPR